MVMQIRCGQGQGGKGELGGGGGVFFFFFDKFSVRFYKYIGRRDYPKARTDFSPKL